MSSIATCLVFIAQAEIGEGLYLGPQSSLDPAGPQAARIKSLFLDYFWVSVTAYALVMLLLIAAVVVKRKRRLDPEAVFVEPAKRGEHIRGWLLVGGVIATTAVLFFLLIGDHAAGRAMRSLSTENAVKIRVTAHQWWWELRYEDPTPSNILTTANEIHIPVGRPVEFELLTADVIHSFWIPNLHGKRDMIPARTTRSILQADYPGTYWGQCAEFCGHQHAKMRFKVVAESEEEFQSWLNAQRQPAAEPTTESQKQGKAVFLGSTCVMCHTVLGTGAGGMVGPDLTHIASRSHIAAGSLRNTRGNLAGWIANPQHIKPGVRMPPNALSPQQLQQLLDYLQNLK